MRISIALASYNGERFLHEQLDSFVAQSRQPDELVVCDDGSQDSTWALLNAFAPTAPFPVRLYRNEQNLGYAQNFARVLGLAHGDLIFMSDQDDVWFPQKLARMEEAFARPEVWAATCDQEIADADLRPSGQSVLSQVRGAGATGGMFTIGCCTAIRSSFRSVLLPLPAAAVAHDAWLDVLSKSLDVHTTVPVVLQYHRRHAFNASSDRLNRTSRVSRMSLLRHALAVSPDQKTFLYPYVEAVIARLEQDADDVPFDRRVQGLEFARRQLATLKARHAIAQMPRRRRLGRVVGLLRGGQYRQFSGWRSALKDLVATRSPADVNAS